MLGTRAQGRPILRLGQQALGKIQALLEFVEVRINLHQGRRLLVELLPELIEIGLEAGSASSPGFRDPNHGLTRDGSHADDH
jgi:hypothetical protein